MKRLILICMLSLGFVLSWSIAGFGDFYVIPVTKCCTCAGTLYENRWCDNGDGTVTDLTTCLVWLQKADWGGTKPWRNSSTDCSSPNYTCYDDAHTRAGSLRNGASGANLSDGSVFGDWRLPTNTELVGLVNGTPNLRCYSMTCDLYAFTGVQSSSYWTSSWYQDFQYAGGVNPAGGFVGGAAKYLPRNVWPVRSGNR